MSVIVTGITIRELREIGAAAALDELRPRVHGGWRKPSDRQYRAKAHDHDDQRADGDLARTQRRAIPAGFEPSACSPRVLTNLGTDHYVSGPAPAPLRPASGRLLRDSIACRDGVQRAARTRASARRHRRGHRSRHDGGDEVCSPSPRCNRRRFLAAARQDPLARALDVVRIGHPIGPAARSGRDRLLAPGVEKYSSTVGRWR